MRLQVDVVSDVICPWCFIGKRRLERALGALPRDVDATVTWRPFELNPEMPREGIERQAYRQAKFGSLEASRALDSRLTTAGAAEGIRFAFDRIRRTPNTFDAHRLIWLAERHAAQDRMVETLFRRYFADGADVGRVEILVDAAAEAGVPPDEARRALQSDDGAAAVRQAEEQSWSLGIHAVPHFIIEGKYGVAGAQSAEVFLSAFQEILGVVPAGLDERGPAARLSSGGGAEGAR